MRQRLHPLLHQPSRGRSPGPGPGASVRGVDAHLPGSGGTGRPHDPDDGGGTAPSGRFRGAVPVRPPARPEGVAVHQRPAHHPGAGGSSGEGAAAGEDRGHGLRHARGDVRGGDPRAGFVRRVPSRGGVAPRTKGSLRGQGGDPAAEPGGTRRVRDVGGDPPVDGKIPLLFDVFRPARPQGLGGEESPDRRAAAFPGGGGGVFRPETGTLPPGDGAVLRQVHGSARRPAVRVRCGPRRMRGCVRRLSALHARPPPGCRLRPEGGIAARSPWWRCFPGFGNGVP